MRDTVLSGKSLSEAVAHGLKKEFGLQARLVSYLGSLVSTFTNWEGAEVQKTTLYFLCELTQIVGERERPEELLGVESVIEWQDPQFLMERMREQMSVWKLSDHNESDIILRALEARRI